MAVEPLSRAAFLGTDGSDGFFDYRPGEHLLIVEPTGGGKTHLAYQLLGEAMRQNPHLSVVSLMPKPADPSTVQWARALNLRETPTWPPRRKLFAGKPDGYVLWPPHALNLPPGERRQQIGEVLRRGLDAQYQRGNSITFIDDAHSAAVMMGLNEHIEELLVNGRAGGSAVWLALQKPSGSVATGGITSFAYSSATHIFLGRDNDQRNIRRFGEIGGFDPGDVESIVRNLRLYRINDHTVSQKLYLDQRGPYKALIGPLCTLSGQLSGVRRGAITWRLSSGRSRWVSRDGWAVITSAGGWRRGGRSITGRTRSRSTARRSPSTRLIRASDDFPAGLTG